MPAEPIPYGVDHDDAQQVANEAERLDVLASRHDRRSRAVITKLGITAGWRCLEVGAGQGSMARWLAGEVGPDGHVLATDLDLHFIGAVPDNVTVQRHDIAADPLPDRHFDLVHARAVLQHVPARDEALGRIVAATAPGGWVVIEDIDWLVFDQQPLPEPFATLHHALRTTWTEVAAYDGYWGRRLLATMRSIGLVDVESKGGVTTMRGGTGGAEWYVMALERAIPRLVEAGAVDESTARAAIAQARQPDFAVLSPLGISAWGRAPA